MNALNEKLVGLGVVASLSESGNTAPKSDTIDSIFSHDAVFDPTEVISPEQTSASTLEADSTKQLDSSVFLPSVFEEKESFGSDVADAIAQRERTMPVRNHWNQSLRSYKINTRLCKIASSCVSLR